MKKWINLSLFSKAYKATKVQIWASLKILLLITVALSLLMLLTEGLSNPNFDIGDALAWPIVKYVEDPADIADAPITVLGKIIGTLVGVIGVAIFAVPAGLIGSGMLDAMDDDKHEKKILEYRGRMRKSFRRTIDLTLKDHLKEAPPRYFVPQRYIRHMSGVFRI